MEDPFPEIKEQVEETAAHLAEQFNIPDDAAEIMQPDVVRKSKLSGDPTEVVPINYDQGKNEVQVDTAVLKPGQVNSLNLGDAVGLWLGEYVATGYPEPYHLPERNFFRMLGAKASAELHSGGLNVEVDAPDSGEELGFELNGDVGAEDVIHQMVDPPEHLNNRQQEYLKETWRNIAEAVGREMADRHYQRAMEDENLIYRSPEQIREEYTQERLEEIASTAL